MVANFFQSLANQRGVDDLTTGFGVLAVEFHRRLLFHKDTHTWRWLKFEKRILQWRCFNVRKYVLGVRLIRFRKPKPVYQRGGRIDLHKHTLNALRVVWKHPDHFITREPRSLS